MSNFLKNVVRTLVPTIVGALGAVWAKVAGHLDTTQFAALVPVITTAYYAIIRYFETKYPALSWLLGALPVQPVVPATGTATPATPPAA